jgi:2-iminobutanoate/2-iminopropanoate deaminase
MDTDSANFPLYNHRGLKIPTLHIYIENNNQEKPIMENPQREVIYTDKAPKAIGPYNVGVRAGHFVFTAGQLGLVPETGEFVPGGVEAETRQALINVRSILEAAGSNLNEVVKTTVFLRSMDDFAKMNAVYSEFFTGDFPSRSTVAVAGLPKGGAVEIEVIAMVA